MKQKTLSLFIFLFLLVANSVQGQVPTLPEGVLFPDNIVDADCADTPPGVDWSFTKLAENPAEYSVDDVSTPVVGDIDNDGITEIIIPAVRLTNPFGFTNKIQIFEYKNSQILHQQTLNTPYFFTTAGQISIAKVDGNDYASIFLCTTYTQNSAVDQGKLIKYVYNSSTQLYEEFRDNGAAKRGTYSALSNKEVAQPMIVDLNGDGISEVVTYDKVFNAKTMELLVNGNLLQYANTAGDAGRGFGFGGHFNNKNSSEACSIMAIGDMDNDGIPEVIGGDCVYKVNITNPNGISGNTFTLWSKCDKTDINGSAHGEVADGATSIADIDGDGYLDIAVTVWSRRIGSGSGALYIWNPRTKKVIHTNRMNIPVYNISSQTCGPSVPFIGDIDGDKDLEICLTGYNIMYAVEYDKTLKIIASKWSKGTNDASASTTMSLFDFDQDDQYELVYRDDRSLRIINGTDGVDKIIPPIACTSLTGIEYPVVADVNNDGSAEIIVTGDAKIHVYSSNPVGLWAPARKVWNQFAYNAVNINNDLTVPKKQMNPATRFPGDNNILGDADDVYPFNGYLMQQTILNTNGMPLWAIPNGQIVGTPTFNYDQETDNMQVIVQVTNAGSASFETPFYVTVYNEEDNTKKFTFTYSNPIAVGATATLSFTIPNFEAEWMPYSIILKINDSGNGSDNQTVCEPAEPYIYRSVSPLRQEICMDKSVETITCNITLPGGTNPTYRWQTSRDQVAWTYIPDATSASYTPSNKKRGTFYYRVAVTVGSETVYSFPSKLRVKSCRIPVNHNISVSGYYD